MSGLYYLRLEQGSKVFIMCSLQITSKYIFLGDHCHTPLQAIQPQYKGIDLYEWLIHLFHDAAQFSNIQIIVHCNDLQEIYIYL
jgi:hypothetical protein